ncbi:uncharacterized protein LOC129872285 [Solanum dulcamara]|uniref:uncharacterized protein LOC129872285 n=1 Tax=Solanum dulcamara TaxID=45834 RepID=UPI002485D43C|nr:uncharacterized protein LOC129872285 [Solanum dulcamara]XP_055803190.1 uncharacterized protein LOC129872285 [Solanum dulcamara]XP_055803191.1 uncharacterized protein LOC129872285 [Solanum dulcamara]
MASGGNWGNEEELELVNEDGFVYKRRKKFQLDPTTSAAPKLKDPAIEEKNRLQRKKTALIKIKDRYQNEINQWELLSTTLTEMQQNQPKLHERDTVSFDSRDPPAMSSDPTCQPLVDQLLTQVEAQEAVIGNISKLCDVVEAVWTAQEEKMKQSVLDLPIWAHTPGELISSLCAD